MSNYCMGVDIGTTSVKVIAFSATGEVVMKQSLPYEMYHPEPDYHEQDADEILAAIITGINLVLQSLLPAVPQFISFSAAMHSLLAVDSAGLPLTRCMIWADNRAASIAESLAATAWGREIYDCTGVPVHAMSPLCKLLWLQQHKPAIFRDAHKFIGIKEYVFNAILGEYIIDTSVASATGLLNLRSLEWDSAITAFAQVPITKLPRVVPVKHVTYYEPAMQRPPLLHLPYKTPIVAGGSDGALSNIGAGATGSHSMAVTIGTSMAARVFSDKAVTDSHMRTFCYHAKDSDYIIGGAGNNGAIVLQWLKDTVLQATESYDQLFEMAATVAPGSDGLVFLPYLLGERAPLWNSNAKGVFFGLSIYHTRAHFIRACMEGIVYGMYSVAKILMEERTVTEVYATGGFAGSDLWLQMMADIVNRNVYVSDTIESAALGAVIVGMEATGIKPALNKNMVSVHKPDPGRNEVYMNRFRQLERLYLLLKEEFTADAS